MTRCFAIVLAGVAVLGSACADSRLKNPAHGQIDSLPTILQEGVVYTPVDRSAEGCVLYNVRIPGGLAPAALVYQNEEGTFSYSRPSQCVKNSDTE